MSQPPYAGIGISAVVPFLDERDSLGELIERLERVLSRLAGNDYEVVFVDDGSRDGSFEVVRAAHARNERIRAIRFRRNYGKSAALAVGFEHARYGIVVTLDADLQDDPDEIPKLLAKLDEGYDVVSGWKHIRHDPLEKTLPSKLFNAVTSLASGIRLHDFNCGLKAYRAEVVKTLTIYGEMHRYIPALAHWEGFRVTEVPVRHHPRKHGRSKFGASRYVKGFLDLLTVLLTTRYLKRPLHLFGSVGTLLLVAGFIIAMVLTIEWALGGTYLTNRPLLLMAVAFMIVGMQLISIGLVGELIVRQSQSTREYHVRERL
ncbi:MAG: glycosyltransferase family 2 protein [Chlorobi bacterium]|jgi:glycosyltransferase involved in cell wall biosynthesis|nr:glycosyltransferase family 2 protein [Chlorobiota bacterium]